MWWWNMTCKMAFAEACIASSIFFNFDGSFFFFFFYSLVRKGWRRFSSLQPKQTTKMVWGQMSSIIIYAGGTDLVTVRNIWTVKIYQDLKMLHIVSWKFCCWSLHGQYSPRGTQAVIPSLECGSIWNEHQTTTQSGSQLLIRGRDTERARVKKRQRDPWFDYFCLDRQCSSSDEKSYLFLFVCVCMLVCFSLRQRPLMLSGLQRICVCVYMYVCEWQREWEYCTFVKIHT